MTDPSSITSVTEEEISDESDTTETESSNSKLSDSISSIMYSSECNTDDKLTSSLVNISISNQNRNRSSKKRSGNHEECIDSVSTTSSIPCHNKKTKSHQAKKKHKSFHSTSLTKFILQKKLSNMMIHKSKPFLPKQDSEDFGFDDSGNCLYTDFSDTSTVPGFDVNVNNHCQDDSVYEEDNVSIDNDQREDEEDKEQRPFFPDLNSSRWFQATCFDRYWSHYNFVMKWYQQHVQAVNALSLHMNMQNVGVPWPVSPNSKSMSKKKRAKRAKNRARNRRLAKARVRAAQAAASLQEARNEASEEIDSDTDNSEPEMEITDEMMDFFAKSYKHRMERDDKKKENDCYDKNAVLNVDISKDDELPGPREQPGVRKRAEMSTLYGEGAPMIHGMETAIQMTYDKVLDRHRPKLWPNIPLKIKFV